MNDNPFSKEFEKILFSLVNEVEDAVMKENYAFIDNISQIRYELLYHEKLITHYRQKHPEDKEIINALLYSPQNLADSIKKFKPSLTDLAYDSYINFLYKEYSNINANEGAKKKSLISTLKSYLYRRWADEIKGFDFICFVNHELL